MKPIYALRNVLDKHPNIISGAVMAWVNLAVIAEWVKIDGKTASALNLALAATLALFVASKTANVSVLNDLADTPPSAEGVALAPVVGDPAPTARRRKPRGEAGQITPERALSIAILAAVAVIAIVVLLRLVPA